MNISTSKFINGYDGTRDSSVVSVLPDSKQFPLPVLSQISGSKLQKLQFCNQYVEHWNSLKKTAEQQILMAGDQDNNSSDPSHSSSLETPATSPQYDRILLS